LLRLEPQQLRECQVQRAADRGEQLGRDLFAAAFELGQVRHRYPGGRCDFAQRAALGQSGAA
jgi:hypothetical protein